MLRLLGKIILFVLIILFVISPVILVNKSVVYSALNSDAFKLAPNINTLIVGDSHSWLSLDPNIITGSVNVSESGECIFYTYYKLKYFIKQNPGVLRNVILAFSYHNISKKYQEGFLFEEIKSSSSMEKYYLISGRCRER